MNKANYILLYIFAFIVGAVILRISGLVSFSSIELLSWILVLSGITAVYFSMGSDRKGLIFIGSTVFLTGILIFINYKFDLEDTRMLLFPAVLLIIGIGFLMLFIDDSTYKIFLGLALVFILFGTAYLLFSRTAAFTGFFASFLNLVESYWIILLLMAGLIFLLRNKT